MRLNDLIDGFHSRLEQLLSTLEEHDEGLSRVVTAFRSPDGLPDAVRKLTAGTAAADPEFF